MNNLHILYHQRKLPHYHPKGQPLFITFRTSDLIPEYLLQEYHEYKAYLNQQEKKRKDDKELELVNQKKLFAKMDDIFTRYQGKIHLTQNPEVARMIAKTFQDWHGKMYHLYAYTIMPNHVHLVLKPRTLNGEQITVSEIMQRIKGSSARQANIILSRTGPLWSREYYDHWPRSGKELIRIMEYVRQNPVAAKLVTDPVAWPWTWVNTATERV